jgi:hypothetical protein
MRIAKAKAKTNETFIVQASLMIVTYDRKNMFIVQATRHLTKNSASAHFDKEQMFCNVDT